MSATPFLWLRRAFDLVCAVAGLSLVAFLGPWMLMTAAITPVPQAQELTRLQGTIAACRPVFGGVRLLLQERENEFQLQLESCADVPADSAHPTHVVLNVMPADLRATRPHEATPGFGVEIEGRVIHTIDSDLRTARLDRAVVTAT